MEKNTLVGTVVKTITIPVYKAKDFASAVWSGNFDDRDALSGVISQFGKERVGLAAPVQVELVEFDREWRMDEVIAWGTNGDKGQINVAHLMGIAIGFPNEQRTRPIVELGSVRAVDVLCLYGYSGWRGLSRGAVESFWRRRCLVGFLNEPA